MESISRRDPDRRGYFGEFGGRYVPETLVEPVEELERAYFAARDDAAFGAELAQLLKHYVGRPTPISEAARLTAAAGGARMFLKREDLTHTGAHKINNALGFVFWPGSPRFVDPYRAKAIVASLPPFVSAVGLFVNQPPAHVASVASLVRLSVVQLHGDEAQGVAAAIGRPIVRALSLQAAARELDQWPPHVTILLDAHDPERRGGTGRTIDWDAAATIARRRRVVLAGGLTPENVADAIGRVRPFGVDVSSGVESAPGIKDAARLRALFESLHGIDIAARS